LTAMGTYAWPTRFHSYRVNLRGAFALSTVL
jgi:hypothetical protein